MFWPRCLTAWRICSQLDWIHFCVNGITKYFCRFWIPAPAPIMSSTIREDEWEGSKRNHENIRAMTRSPTCFNRELVWFESSAGLFFPSLYWRSVKVPDLSRFLYKLGSGLFFVLKVLKRRFVFCNMVTIFPLAKSVDYKTFNFHPLMMSLIVVLALLVINCCFSCCSWLICKMHLVSFCLRNSKLLCWVLPSPCVTALIDSRLSSDPKRLPFLL